MLNTKKFLWIEAVQKEGSFEHLGWEFLDSFDTTIKKIAEPLGGYVSTSFCTTHEERVGGGTMPQKMAAVKVGREKFQNPEEADRQLREIAAKIQEKLSVRYFDISITIVTRTEEQEALCGKAAEMLVPHNIRV